MKHEYITEKNSISASLNDALTHAYEAHEKGEEITDIHINLEEGKIFIVTKEDEENAE